MTFDIVVVLAYWRNLPVGVLHKCIGRPDVLKATFRKLFRISRYKPVFVFVLIQDFVDPNWHMQTMLHHIMNRVAWTWVPTNQLQHNGAIFLILAPFP